MSGSENEIWGDDLLNRQNDAIFLRNFLVSRKKAQGTGASPSSPSYVVNLDETWGQGKTFFLTRFARQLKEEGHLVAFVNAWKDDFCEDPLIPVMAEVDNAIKEAVPPRSPARNFWEASKKKSGPIFAALAKGAAANLAAKLVTREAVSAITDIIGAPPDETAKEAIKDFEKDSSAAINKILDKAVEKELSSLQKIRESILNFKNSLAKAIKSAEEKDNRPTPMFIFIDELDRCKPSYAIALLERVKHLFDIEDVIFIIATDSTQLGHAIKSVYGNDFDSSRYLKRFFDRTFTFPEPSKKDFINVLLNETPIDERKVVFPLSSDISSFLTQFFTNTKIDLRTSKQIYNTLEIIVSSWQNQFRINLLLLLPMILAHHVDKRYALDYRYFMDFIKDSQIFEWSLLYNKHYDSNVSIPGFKPMIISMAEAVQSNMSKYLNNSNPKTPFDRYLYDTINEEYNVRYNGKAIERGDDFSSYCKLYPQIVSQAGRVITIT